MRPAPAQIDSRNHLPDPSLRAGFLDSLTVVDELYFTISENAEHCHCAQPEAAMPKLRFRCNADRIIPKIASQIQFHSSRSVS
jgi:hypothetical protein